MSISPTGSTQLVQAKPEKQNQPAPSTSLPVERSTEVVAPTTPIQPIGQISQESQTEISLTDTVDKKPISMDPEIADEIQNAVEKLNSFMNSMKRDLEFQFDQEIGQTIVTVRDSNTQEVVRKMPSEAAIKLAKVLQEVQSQEVQTQKNGATIGQLLDIKT